MMNKDKFVTMDKRYSTFIPKEEIFNAIFEISKGVKRKIFSENKDSKPFINYHLVKNFFESRSRETSFDDFVDSSTTWYLNFLSESTILNECLQSTKSLRIFDVGCGRAFLYKWITERRNSNSFYYVGVDIDQVAISNCQRSYSNANVAFYSTNIVDSKLNFTVPFNLLFFINIFPYIEKIVDVLQNIINAYCQKDSLIIAIDPIPSVFWEREFGEMVLYLRYPSSLCYALSEAGLLLLEKKTLFAFYILGIFLFPLSFMTVWKPVKLNTYH